MKVKMIESLSTIDEDGVMFLERNKEYELSEYLTQSFINSGHAEEVIETPKRGRPKIDNKLVKDIENKEDNILNPENKED